MEDKVYRASAELLIDTQSGRFLFGATNDNAQPIRVLRTQIAALKGPAIRRAVEAEIPNAPVISVVAMAQVGIVKVNAESTVPQLAVRTADAYARAYIEYRRNRSIAGLAAAGREIQKTIDARTAEVADVDTQLEAASKNPGGALTGSLTARRDSLIAQPALFRQRLDQLQVDAGLQESQAQVTGPARAPTDPVRTTPLRTALLASLAGLLTVVVIALLRDWLAERLRTQYDIEQAVPGLQVLAASAADRARMRSRTQLVVTSDPNTPRGEAYRTPWTSTCSPTALHPHGITPAGGPPPNATPGTSPPACDATLTKSSASSTTPACRPTTIRPNGTSA